MTIRYVRPSAVSEVSGRHSQRLDALMARGNATPGRCLRMRSRRSGAQPRRRARAATEVVQHGSQTCSNSCNSLPTTQTRRQQTRNEQASRILLPTSSASSPKRSGNREARLPMSSGRWSRRPPRSNASSQMSSAIEDGA